MDLSEICWKKATASSFLDQAREKTFTIKRGTNVLFLDQESKSRELTHLQHALCAIDPAFSSDEKKEFFQAFYRDDLAAMPQSFENNIAAVATTSPISFLFFDDPQQITVQEHETDKIKKYILPGSIGREEAILAQRLDFRFLLDDSIDLDEQKQYLRNMSERLKTSRTRLADPINGKLYRIREELLALLQNPVLKSDIDYKDYDAQKLRSWEKRLNELKIKDDRLREEQRTLMLLSIKNDYEKLLKLRSKLKELENNTSLFEERITGHGREITVHELTELSNAYQAYKEEENRYFAQLEEVKELEELRLDYVQQSILAEHRFKQSLERYKDNINQPLVLHKEKTPTDKPKQVLGQEHYLLLFAAILLLLGLIIFPSVKILSIIVFVISAFSLLSSLYLFSKNRNRKKKEKHLEGLFKIHSTNKDDVKKYTAEQKQNLRNLKEDFEQTKEQANYYTTEYKKASVALNTSKMGLKRHANMLKRQFARYAAISDLDDAEFVLDALRNQRQSVASYDEAVAEILRNIANVRKGRTDADMMREYESACKELYGDVSSANGTERQSQIRSQSLNYDPNRAKDIENERVLVSTEIDELKNKINTMRNLRDSSDDIVTQRAELTRRRKSLELSLWEIISDIEELDLAISVLDYLALNWPQYGRDVMRSQTLAYARRLQGLQMASSHSADFLIEQQLGIRRGNLTQFQEKKNRDAELNLIEDSANDVIYSAFRIAFIDSNYTFKNKPPLFLFDLSLLDSKSRLEECFNLLDERVLDRAAQTVIISCNRDVYELATERNYSVHLIGDNF